MTTRKAYPRPQFVREAWQNLNGSWQFCFDDNNEGLAEKWYLDEKEFRDQIEVPFVYQCKLSGIQEDKNHEILWYKKSFEIETNGKERVLLHFGAVDYHAMIFLNGGLVCEHEGGHTSFTVDITDFLDKNKKEQSLAVRVYDPLEDELIPRGKQIWEDQPKGIWYTGTTGIWQTVWVEKVNHKYISDLKFTSLFDEGKESIICITEDTDFGDAIAYQISFEGNTICEGEVKCHNHTIKWDVDLIQNHIFRTNFHDNGWAWTPESPSLFEVLLVLKDAEGHVFDRVESYFGFRKVHKENGMVYLNNKPYYQKLVLDQGYWREGLMTAPADEAFKRDIELAKEMGFNGCRKHQKTEDPIFLYWADKLGFLVWGECASTVMYDPKAVKRLMTEWTEIIQRDYNHPSIIVWVPLNESWGIPNVHRNSMQQHFSQTMYHVLHALDDTRLVISNDGWEMTETDICAIHNYMHGQKEEVRKFAHYREMLANSRNLIDMPSTCWDIYAKGFAHTGEPVMLTEFGGIGFELSGEGAWGYTSVENEDDFLEDYTRIMDTIFDSVGLCGYCYTQLTDVEQEMNGLLTYDRRPKCDLTKIRAINERYHSSR